MFITIGFATCFICLGYRLMIIANSEYSKLSPHHKTNIKRREIVDRNGNLLAINLPSSSLFANPQKVVDHSKVVAKLVKMWPNLDKKKLITDLKSNKSFVWIKRDITPDEYEEVFNLGLPGFDFEQEQKRLYTFSNLTSHIIGYVGRDFSGLAGIEKRFDKLLSNSDNQYASKNDELEHHKPLELSIDIRLQSILNEEIEKTMKDFSAVGAVGIIANPKNGEILAMVSKPDFDPHQPHKASTEQLFNRSSLGVYETGSVFKTLTMAIGLDVEAITLNDAYDVSYMKVGKFQVKDYHPHHGWQTVPEIFLHSSNIGVGQIILEIGKNHLKHYFKNLGLLDQLQIELPERGTPLCPPDARWSDLSLVTMSYGYGLSITPLHFIQAALPAVNGGNFFPLTLIKKSQNELVSSTRVFSHKTSDDMRKLMRLVVQEGTGKRAEVKGYLVGGKTGTAEKLLGKKYVKNSRISSFLGVLPASDPQYIIYIMFDEPKGNKESFGFATAGFTAAPAVGRVLERLVALYGIESINENSPEAQKVINVNFKINNEI
ncbi:MAG: penicillin-binding protein 2 [Rickettsiaceae bacterium]|nr:MAG: penicillin-binding protein 2 [Rickettsiaceae bacterium]